MCKSRAMLFITHLPFAFHFPAKRQGIIKVDILLLLGFLTRYRNKGRKGKRPLLWARESCRKLQDPSKADREALRLLLGLAGGGVWRGGHNDMLTADWRDSGACTNQKVQFGLGRRPQKSLLEWLLSFSGLAPCWSGALLSLAVPYEQKLSLKDEVLYRKARAEPRILTMKCGHS